MTGVRWLEHVIGYYVATVMLGEWTLVACRRALLPGGLLGPSGAVARWTAERDGKR